MPDALTRMNALLDSLKERAKELACLYEVEEALRNNDAEFDQMLAAVVRALPAGWCYPEHCQARIFHDDRMCQTPDYRETEWRLRADIVVQGEVVGRVEVSYDREMPALDEGPFLHEERKLLNTIADRIGQTLLHRQLAPLVRQLQTARRGESETRSYDWRVVLDMLRITDRDLLLKISRRMLNYLCYIGVEEAKRLLEEISGAAHAETVETEHDGVNRPTSRLGAGLELEFSDRVVAIASRHLSSELIFSYFQKWIRENKVAFLLDALEDNSSSLSDIVDAIARYKDSDTPESELSRATVSAVSVSLIRRFFSRRLEFITLAKKHATLEDFFELSRRLVFPEHSYGRLGGKAAGLFLAMQIIKTVRAEQEELQHIRAPKTWYIASDGIIDFLHYNHLEELLEYKYHDIDQIRMEYPNLVQLLKNSSFSPAMIQGIALALDDFGDRPLVVRSSTFLEDSAGAAFSGKYKSLFVANQGSKQQRLSALLDAIAEVYSSMFSPDPIEYRAERGLLDYPEEMGILLQEVVGTRIGPYLCPAFAGVAFSNNEFRWSPRIKREDGLVRLVPGLGTRAVDRLSSDYPILIAPGQPGLRVNATPDETLRYSPHYVDAINLETNSIETVPLEELLAKYGDQYPRAREIFSVVREGMLRPVTGMTDFARDKLAATFEGLATRTPFLKQIKTLLDVLASYYGMPMDLEFAADDKDFYLLQCRAQSRAKQRAAAALPRDPRPESIVFTANRYVSDGYAANLTYIVYVSPEGYDRLESLEDLRAVARVVGRLNNLLPKRQFVLIGPGRWGSRGDIKLGVNVGYSDINNTAALIEVAFKKGDYTPDLSFGTHFFQDLVEAEIAYLPLYPDDPSVVFNREVLYGAPNLLAELLPDAARFSDVVRVIDVKRIAGGRTLTLVMNGDEGKAIALLDEAAAPPLETLTREVREEQDRKARELHWMWRLGMAEKIAASIDPARFGVKAMYVIGSTKNATAGPYSDIDLLIHVEGGAERIEALRAWLDGWSLCLGEMNYLRTGYRCERLLDLHFVTDEDIRMKTGYAAKISAVSDAARPLRMKAASA
jgi:GAF domain-containing protein/predicted nucleotidyltransferase